MLPDRCQPESMDGSSILIAPSSTIGVEDIAMPDASKILLSLPALNEH